MKSLSNVSWLNMNGKEVLFLGDDYSGWESQGYEPDILLCTERSYNKFLKSYIFRPSGKMKVIFLD